MIEPMPKAPPGYACCRVGGCTSNIQISHLVIEVDNGFHGPTLCGLTRFDSRDKNYVIVRAADLPGWSMNGGVSGPDVAQEKCPTCWERA